MSKGLLPKTLVGSVTPCCLDAVCSCKPSINRDDGHMLIQCIFKNKGTDRVFWFHPTKPFNLLSVSVCSLITLKFTFLQTSALLNHKTMFLNSLHRSSDPPPPTPSPQNNSRICVRDQTLFSVRTVKIRPIRSGSCSVYFRLTQKRQFIYFRKHSELSSSSDGRNAAEQEDKGRWTIE